jgi:hypothetical protein
MDLKLIRPTNLHNDSFLWLEFSMMPFAYLIV